MIAWVLIALVGATPIEDEKRSYETERLELALKLQARVIDPAPEGKRIGKVVVVRDDVFADDEWIPTFLNVFHARTKDHVVRRELLFGSGEVWDQARVDESMRNLRDQTIFAHVRIVPVIPDPAEAGVVDVFVYTRDLWSLRLETPFQLVDDFVSSFELTLIERNLAGENIQGALSFELMPLTFSFGESFQDRRLFGSRWSLSEAFEVIFERDSGEAEGTAGRVVFGLPLWDLRPRWGLELDASWIDSVGRQASGATILTYDDPQTADVETIPRIWDQSYVRVTLAALRQLGEGRWKWRLTSGLGGYVTDYTPHADTGLAGLDEDDPRVEAFAAEVLPRSRTEIYPFIKAETFVAEWARFVNLGSYGVTEEVRIGPWASAVFLAPLEAFGSSDDALVWEAAAGFIAAPRSPLSGRGDRGLIDLLVGYRSRAEQSQVVDQYYRVRLRSASPQLGFGRLVGYGELEIRGKDLDDTLVALGGDNGLRGYASQAFYGFGSDRVRFSAEWRTPPAVLGSIHFGGVLFYDAGGVGDLNTDQFEMHHAAGVGLRVMIPQLNRFAVCFDVGFPLDVEQVTVLLTIGTGQPVPLTALEDQQLED